jgi:hypothetical protein
VSFLRRVGSWVVRFPVRAAGVLVLAVIAVTYVVRRYRRIKRLEQISYERARKSLQYRQRLRSITHREAGDKVRILKDREIMLENYRKEEERLQEATVNDTRKLREEWDKWFSSRSR